VLLTTKRPASPPVVIEPVTLPEAKLLLTVMSPEAHPG